MLNYCATCNGRAVGMAAATGGDAHSRDGGGGVLAAAALALMVVLAVAGQAAGAAAAAGDGDEEDTGTCGRRPVVFAFGDSNTDTGGAAAGMGHYYPLPAGRSFFRHPTGRLCDGRLVLDYLCESLNMSYLSPYLEALASDFTGGANFAVSGSSTLPRGVPFSLHVQVQQFLHFKQRCLDLAARGGTAPVDADGFRNALYLIDIGQNDLAAAFGSGDDDVVRQRIPAIVSEIKDAVISLYYNGAKNFWVHGTGPLGCLPQKLAAPRANGTADDLDYSGCLKTLNNGAYEFNAQLCAVRDELASQLRGVTVVYTDLLAIKYELVANHTEYGFEEPLMACCGYGGPPYNYSPTVGCLGPGFRVCEDGAKYLSWDGVHYTDAANAVVAAKILSGEFSRPNLPFSYFCRA